MPAKRQELELLRSPGFAIEASVPDNQRDNQSEGFL
jgi:hypothetical protein